MLSPIILSQKYKAFHSPTSLNKEGPLPLIPLALARGLTLSRKVVESRGDQLCSSIVAEEPLLFTANEGDVLL